MKEILSNEAFLSEVEPVVTRLFDRHLENAHEWYPHETTPWSMARNFTDADPWNPDEYPLPEGVRSALFVNLLTEDNLPYYTHTILSQSDDAHPLNEWTRRWTAEEARHSVAIRDWIMATRAFDPRLLEQGRMAQMSGGKVPQADSLEDMIAYVSLQELATNVAHANTGRMLDKDNGGRKVMARVAGDEALHYVFYRDLVGAGLEIDPSGMMIAIARQLRTFKMPGTGIPEFEDHEVVIAQAGIFDVSAFYKKVVVPTIETWDIWNVCGLSPEAERSRDRIKARLGSLARASAVHQELIHSAV